MTEEKMRILTMLSEGKISTEEAEKLIDALDKQDEPQKGPGNALDLSGDKHLYIKVEPKEGKSSDQVSVKVPFGLLKAGLNIAGLIPKDAQEKINSSMDEKGMSFNLSDIKPENIREIMAALEEFSVDIDTAESEVKIYCQ